MPRKPREKSATGIYHVMLRGINRQNIFYDQYDYKDFLTLLRKQARPENQQHQPLPPHCIVYAYCLMPNHVHLLIKEKNEDIASVMKSIGVGYAWHYNNKYQHMGAVFQDRFRSEPVNDDAYFFTLMRYIHQNPMKAGLTKDVPSYLWSSWHEYENVTKDCEATLRSLVEKPSLCYTKAVTDRMPLDELRALVFEPLPASAAVLDIDTGGWRKTDDEVIDFFKAEIGILHIQDILLMDKDRQRDAIRQARSFGASIRQLERLTGLSFSFITRM